MNEDRAIVRALAVSPVELLALVLHPREKNPGNARAWLNLGLALRRMALAGHLSLKMLAHYWQARMEAKRRALDALSDRLPE